MTDEIRDEIWLAERVRLLREKHFADMRQGLPIETRFGLRARYRFGSIQEGRGKCIIRANMLFADPYVPVYVVDAMLAHELAHYAHGYGSGLPKLYPDPHRGGVVDKELERRGLGELTRQAEAWREAHWVDFYIASCGDLTQRKEHVADVRQNIWVKWLAEPDRRTEADLIERYHHLASRLQFPIETLPFKVEWLMPIPRQKGTSYCFSKVKIVRLHGLLADKRVPQDVLDFELAYWLMRHRAGNPWPMIETALHNAGLTPTVTTALHWRQKTWPTFHNRHHPLYAHNKVPETKRK